VTHITQQELNTRLNDLVVRTERGNAVVRRNPRELPRRLRVLLLAVDGTHTVQLYVQTLKGFGDIGELLVDLSTLGLVELQPPEVAFRQGVRSQQYSALNDLLDDSRFSSEAADVLYGTTAPGSFDEMLRVAQIEQPDFRPSPMPAPAPVTPEVQKIQIESLFELLDAVRGERRTLKKRLAKMDKLRETAKKLDTENQRLFAYICGLASACVALLIALVVVWMRR
jgi:hypothetical protein